MLNICGLLVHARPDRAEAVVAAIAGTDGCEVHARENGRIVVTVEDVPARRASDRIMDLHQIPGVLNVTLTYHHFEALDEGSDALADRNS